MLFLIIGGGHPGVSLVAAVIAGLMCWELAQVFYTLPDKKEKTIALVGTSWLFMFVNMLFPKTMLECVIASFVGMFMYYLATADRHAETLKRHFDELVGTIFALVYVVLFSSFLPLIRDGLNGVRWVLLFLIIVWAGDTGAYFIGRKYGKKRLYPLISPKKSIEGALGGLATSVAAALIFKIAAFPNLGWFPAMATAILVGIFSQIGDLCESFFKRGFGIKDSSLLLPGHGGVLDRFDGVLFGLPIMYFCVKVFS
jgi:phosphatidate cytidylyltransferase